MGRSLLKLKTKGSMMTHNSGSKKEQEHKYWSMDNVTFSQLALVRRTIGYKLTGFRFKLIDLE